MVVVVVVGIYTQPTLFQLFWIVVMKTEILRSFDAFDAAVSSGGMFGTGLILPGAARSLYANLGVLCAK